MERNWKRLFSALLLLLSVVVTGCSTTQASVKKDYFTLEKSEQTQEIVVYAIGLLGTNYRFGGNHPEAGLDCSGMVSYVVAQVSGRKLPHNAARIAAMTQPIKKEQLQPGDLVFFNTSRKKYSHMGIYLGSGKFIHAPATQGQVRVEKLDNPYFKKRFDGARTLLARGD